MHPVIPSCPFYWHIVADSSLLWSLVFLCLYFCVVISSFSFLILLIWFFSPFFLMSLANGLSIWSIFLKNQLLVLLIFCYSLLCFFFIYFCPNFYDFFPSTNPESESEVAQSCPTLGDPMDCSPPGSSIHGIFQVRVLEWVAISFSRVSSWLRDWTWVSCIADRCFTVWATRELTLGFFISSFPSCFRCKVRLFIWFFSCFFR